MKSTAQASVEAPAWAKITAAEAAMTCNPIIGVLAVDLKEIHDDLPFLPKQMQAQGTRP
jgi:hypothetical protein